MGTILHTGIFVSMMRIFFIVQSNLILINKTNDLILNLTPENVTQHYGIE